MQFNQFQSAGQFRVLEVIVPTTGTYNNMYLREYGMHSSLENLNNLQAATHNFTKFDQESVMSANSNGGMMNLSTTALGQVSVSGHWGDQRQVIILKLENPNTRTLHIVSGFTDPTFLDGAGNINPYATVKFDSVVTLVPEYDPMTQEIREYCIQDANNILGANSVTSNGNVYMTEAQRPVDIFQKAALQSVFADDMGGAPMRTQTHDTVSVNTTFSQHRNGIGNDYLCRTLAAYHDGAANNQDMESRTYGSSDDSVTRLNGATQSAMVSEVKYMGNDIVTTLLANVEQQRSSTITWADLSMVLPEINSQGILNIIRGDGGANGTGTGVQSWGGRYEAVYAGEIATAVSALVMRYGITVAGFQITTQPADPLSMNYAGGCQFVWLVDGNGQIEFRGSVAHLPMARMADHFETYVRTVIFPRIAGSNNSINCQVRCNAYKDMTIIISVNGEEFTTFVAPTFAFGLWSPVNANNMYGADHLASSMLELFNYIDNSNMNTSPAMPVGEYDQTLQFVDHAQPQMQPQMYQQPMQPMQPQQVYHQEQMQQPMYQQPTEQPMEQPVITTAPINGLGF